MRNEESHPVWFFQFGLEGEEGEPVRRELAEKLLDHIVEWAETHGCQVGGGFRPPEPEEI